MEKAEDDNDYQGEDPYASSIDKMGASQTHVESIKSKNSKYTDQQTINTEGNKFSSKRYDEEYSPETVGKNQTI